MSPLQDAPYDVSLSELLRRDVHGDPHSRESKALPVLAVQGRSLDHPLSHGDDQTTRFQDRQESSGRDETGVRIVPPDQGFHALDAPRLHVDLRLIVELELLPLHRDTQLSFQRPACELRGVSLRIEMSATLSRQLGRAQGRLRLLHQSFCILGIVRIYGHTGAGGHGYILSLQSERLREDLVQHVIQRPRRGLHRPRHRLDDRECSACEMSEVLGILEASLQPISQQLQQMIAGVASE